MKSKKSSFLRGNHRRLSSSVLARRKMVLDVRVRSSTARRSRRNTILSWTGIFLFWTLFVGGAAYFAQHLLDKFFFENADYNIQHVELQAGEEITLDEAMAVTGIRKGTNIFRVDMGVAVAALEQIPEVQEATVKRELPDTIVMKVETREPVAWLLGSGDAQKSPTHLVDHSLFVYEPRKVLDSHYSLPVVSGVDFQRLEAGDPLHRQDLLEAVDLLQVRNFFPSSSLVIRSVDVSKGYSLVVRDETGCEIHFEAGNYPPQLERLEKLLQHCRETGRQLEFVNLIPKRNTPVRFVMNAVPRAEAVVPKK